MFPFRTSSIFRSRWMALFWAAGIIWTAVDFAGSPEAGANNANTADGSGATVDNDQMKQAEKLIQAIGR